MSLEFLGSTPDNMNSYKCTRCGIEFEIREMINNGWDTQPMEPNYCPVCAM